MASNSPEAVVQHPARASPPSPVPARRAVRRAGCASVAIATEAQNRSNRAAGARGGRLENSSKTRHAWARRPKRPRARMPCSRTRTARHGHRDGGANLSAPPKAKTPAPVAAGAPLATAITKLDMISSPPECSGKTEGLGSLVSASAVLDDGPSGFGIGGIQSTSQRLQPFSDVCGAIAWADECAPLRRDRVQRLRAGIAGLRLK
jgi:hypothetical protein